MSEDLEQIIDHTGELRMLSRLPVNDDHRKMRAGVKSFRQFLSETGRSLPPRSEWTDVDRRGSMGIEYVNNQKSSSGCVGWSSAQALMRARAIRGKSFQKLSGAFIYAHINGGRDAGSVITDALSILQAYGTCLESQMNYPQIYERQITADETATAGRFRVTQALTIDTFDEICYAIELGGIVVAPIQVGSNFEQFDKYGKAGASRGWGNHSVHFDGKKKLPSGEWVLDMPNSWDVPWGPFGNGRCYISEAAINGADQMQDDAYVIFDVSDDPQDPNNPPKPAE